MNIRKIKNKEVRRLAASSLYALRKTNVSRLSEAMENWERGYRMGVESFALLMSDTHPELSDYIAELKNKDS